ncbi:MAG: hypothetical protein M0R05_03090 [Bacilli bacterium]|nr:hypothetical protein [Bacilli bacterium]MDD3085388.1 hypothetical protein [Candidatus ainarchaeum sp.]
MNEQRSKLNEYWTEVITDFISSGLSQKEYAKQKNLKAYSLGYWYRKYSTGFSGFVEAVDNPSNDHDLLTSSIEITINKMKIVIKDSFDEELLLKVIRTVKKI